MKRGRIFGAIRQYDPPQRVIRHSLMPGASCILPIVSITIHPPDRTADGIPMPWVVAAAAAGAAAGGRPEPRAEGAD